MTHRNRIALTTAALLAALFLAVPSPSHAAVQPWKLPLWEQAWSWLAHLLPGGAPQKPGAGQEKEGIGINPNGVRQEKEGGAINPNGVRQGKEGSAINPDGGKTSGATAPTGTQPHEGSAINPNGFQ